jgi:NitT/TauT family transport system substrate-binding protein
MKSDKRYVTHPFSFYLLLFLFIPQVKANAQNENPTKLVFVTHWHPQAEFAGYYVAQAQGFYEEEGLDVEIKSSSLGYRYNAITYLEKGQADIVSNALVVGLLAHQQNNDIVNIAQVSQHSSILFVAKKSSGINSLKDFNHKKIGVWSSDFKSTPQILILKNGLDVTWVPVASVNLFLEDGIDILVTMSYNEYNQLYLSGIDTDELTVFHFSDYVYDIPEDGLYTTRKTLETKQDAMAAFVRASKKGWDYAAKNEEYTLALVIDVMGKAHYPANKAHQKWMLKQILKQQRKNDDKEPSYFLSSTEYQTTVDLLTDTHLLKNTFTYEDFFIPILPGTK